MTLRFDEQVVVITGAAGAIGSAYVDSFAKRGGRVVINDTDFSGGSGGAAHRLAKTVESAGGCALANTDDISTSEGARSLIESTLDHFGRVDVLINNAGIMRDSSFRKMTMEDIDSVIKVNLMGTLYVSHAAFPYMLERGCGRVLMVSSASGLYGVFGAANYAAAKMGVIGLMRALHIEGARRNVFVNAIAPVAGSPLLDKFIPDYARSPRLTPAWLVPLVLYLCSNLTQVSGQIFEAGGGYYARSAVLESVGWRVDGDPPSPEEIGLAMDKIADMSCASELSDSGEVIRRILDGAGSDRTEDI